MKRRLHTLDNCFAGKKRLPATKLATDGPVLSKNCMLFTSRQGRVSLQQSLYLKNSWGRRYTERQNSRRGPPENRTKFQVRAKSAKGE